MASTVAMDHMPYPPILANNCFCSSLMKIINFFAGALVVTTAANVLLPSNAYSFNNYGNIKGWTQMGKACQNFEGGTQTVGENATGKVEAYYRKLKSKTTNMYAIRSNGGWVTSQNLTLAEANAQMNQFGTDWIVKTKNKKNILGLGTSTTCAGY